MGVARWHGAPARVWPVDAAGVHGGRTGLGASLVCALGGGVAVATLAGGLGGQMSNRNRFLTWEEVKARVEQEQREERERAERSNPFVVRIAAKYNFETGRLEQRVCADWKAK